jgi:hypothetical protein
MIFLIKLSADGLTVVNSEFFDQNWDNHSFYGILDINE